MIWLLPLLNALFGWGIISLLIFFIFHPVKKRRFFIVEIQGILPASLPSLAQAVAQYGGSLLSVSKLKKKMLGNEKLNAIHSFLELRVDDFLRNKLPAQIPVLSMFVSESLTNKMKEVLMSQLETMIPEMIEYVANDLEKKIDISSEIHAKLSSLSMSEIEQTIKTRAGKNIFQLKFLAAVGGFILGFIELLLLSLA